MKQLDDLLAPAIQWLNALEQRERYIVIAGGISLAIMLFYLLIWEPITSSYTHHQQQYNSQRQLYGWMKSKAAEIQSLNAAGSSSISRSRNQSIASLADRSATTTGIKPYIEKIDQNKKGVKIRLKSANFDRIVVWLTDLENKYGIVASKVKVETSVVKGAVDVQVTLERSSK